MEKVIALLWAPEGAVKAEYNARLLSHLPAALQAAGGSGVRLNLEDAMAGRGMHLRQSRGEPQHDAVAQFWLPSANRLFRAGIDAALAAVSARWAGWVVAESTVIPNRAHPPRKGTRTWGWAQMAFLMKPPHLARAEWLEAWQGRHTSVAIETQSTFEYVQNLVVRPLTDDAPPYAGIVEECFPEDALTDPLAFFAADGDEERFQANLARMMESCGRFIAPGAIDVIPTGQYTF